MPQTKDNKPPLWTDIFDMLAEFPASVELDTGRIGTFHRALLHGPPGTGKSVYPAKRFGEDKVERITIHPGKMPEEVLGCRDLDCNDEGGTKTIWTDGPAVRAMKEGKILVIDEIDDLGPDLRSPMHALLDDLNVARLTLANGEVVRPAPGYAVIATMNGHPDDLPQALLDRFEMVLLADMPAKGLSESLGKCMSVLINRQYESLREHMSAKYNPKISARRVLAVQTLAKIIDDLELAAELVFGPTTGPNFMLAVESATAEIANANS